MPPSRARESGILSAKASAAGSINISTTNSIIIESSSDDENGAKSGTRLHLQEFFLSRIRSKLGAAPSFLTLNSGLPPFQGRFRRSAHWVYPVRRSGERTTESTFWEECEERAFNIYGRGPLSNSNVVLYSLCLFILFVVILFYFSYGSPRGIK